MNPPPRTSRSRWIEEALQALAGGGPDAVRVEPLAKALGVTRGGFYWHFADRSALLEEVLDAWERASVDDVVERVEAGGGGATTRLRRLSDIADSSGALLKTDLAVRDWARRDAKVAERLRRVDNRRMGYLRSVFAAVCPDADDVEIRCLITFSLWVANDFIAADHGARSREEVLELAMRRLEAPRPGTDPPTATTESTSPACAG